MAAKRKGVVGGVDYQLTGMVRFVQVSKRLLHQGMALFPVIRVVSLMPDASTSVSQNMAQQN